MGFAGKRRACGRVPMNSRPGLCRAGSAGMTVAGDRWRCREPEDVVVRRAASPMDAGLRRHDDWGRAFDVFFTATRTGRMTVVRD